MTIQDVIKKFKLGKFPILMKTQRHSSWRADCPRNWRNRKRKRHSINASEATALWCYSLKINIKDAVEAEYDRSRVFDIRPKPKLLF